MKNKELIVKSQIVLEDKSLTEPFTLKITLEELTMSCIGKKEHLGVVAYTRVDRIHGDTYEIKSYRDDNQLLTVATVTL